jgi:membrane protein implicated in regulation of membrane protease activity
MILHRVAVMDTFIPWIFAALTGIGVLYFLLTIFGASEIAEGLDLGIGNADGQFGCSVVAAFMAGFGAIGLLGTLSGWNLYATIGLALVIGLITGRFLMTVLRFVMNQESTTVVSNDTLIGMSARITINSPAGHTGEAIVEEQYVQKFPVKEMNGAELRRGDVVEIVNVSDGTLYVKKKRAS